MERSYHSSATTTSLAFSQTVAYLARQSLFGQAQTYLSRHSRKVVFIRSDWQMTNRHTQHFRRQKFYCCRYLCNGKISCTVAHKCQSPYTEARTCFAADSTVTTQRFFCVVKPQHNKSHTEPKTHTQYCCVVGSCVGILLCCRI